MFDEASRTKIIFSKVDHSSVVKMFYRYPSQNKKKTAEQKQVKSISAVVRGSKDRSQDSPRKEWIAMPNMTLVARYIAIPHARNAAHE
jgi:hypothetical protein